MAKGPSREELQHAIHGMLSDAVSYMEGELSPDRATATKYYMGEKFGNEETGRSQFILTDVRDTVLAMLPSLVRLFFPTSGHVIEYQARPKTADVISEKVAQADQATEYVNAVVLDQDNSIFAEGYACFKDALVRKIGILKYWWEDGTTWKDYEANNCDVGQYEMMRQDEDVEITSEAQRVDQYGIPRWDLKYRQWRREGFAMIRCVPPEELLISRDARSREDCVFMAHRTEKTTAELLAMGVPQKEIDDYGGPSTEVRQSIEEIARRGGISHTDQAQTEGEVKSLWVEAWPVFDGQLYQVRCLGADCHIVGDPEPIDERPVALFCPDPEPHVLIGQSVAQRVMDLQLMKSSVARAAADGLAASIFPRRYFMEGVVDRQAMASTAMGQDVAVSDGIQPAAAVMIEKVEWQGDAALQLLGYLDAVKQQRVGPLPATVDPNALQSTPEIGVKASVQAAGEQIELIARVFAATGMKQLGKGLLKLLIEHQPRARIVRLRNQYVSVDPRAWDADMDITVNVAIGVDEKMSALAMTAAAQKEALATMGPANPLVTIGQYRHTLATILELQGLRDTTKFYLPVDPAWQPPPPPPQPNPELVLAQAEMQKVQTQMVKIQAEAQQAAVENATKVAQLQAQLASKVGELQLEREQMLRTDEREREKAEAQIAVQMAEINAKYGTALRVADGEALLEREKLATQERLATTKTNGAGKKKSMTMRRGDGQTMTVDIAESGG